MQPGSDDEATTETRDSYDVIARRYRTLKRQRGSGDYLAELLDRFVAGVPTHGRVLDLGCGHGLEVQELVDRGLQAAGLDLSRGMLECACEVAAGRLVQADMRSLPFAATSLDGVWSVHALLHIPPDDLADVISDIRRVPRPGGSVAVSFAGGDGVHREEVAYYAGRYRTFVHRSLETMIKMMGRAGLIVDSAGRAPEAERDTVWIVAHRSSEVP